MVSKGHLTATWGHRQRLINQTRHTCCDNAGRRGLGDAPQTSPNESRQFARKERASETPARRPGTILRGARGTGAAASPRVRVARTASSGLTRGGRKASVPRPTPTPKVASSYFLLGIRRNQVGFFAPGPVLVISQ